MRLLFLALLLFIFQFLLGQDILDKKVSVSFKKQSIEKCIIKLEKVSGVSFSYSSKQIHNSDKVVTASFDKKRIGQVLDNIILSTKFQYKVIGNQITIYELKNTTDMVVLSGYMRDSHSREEIVGGRIYFPDLKIGCC